MVASECFTLKMGNGVLALVILAKNLSYGMSQSNIDEPQDPTAMRNSQEIEDTRKFVEQIQNIEDFTIPSITIDSEFVDCYTEQRPRIPLMVLAVILPLVLLVLVIIRICILCKRVQNFPNRLVIIEVRTQSDSPLLNATVGNPQGAEDMGNSSHFVYHYPFEETVSEIKIPHCDPPPKYFP